MVVIVVCGIAFLGILILFLICFIKQNKLQEFAIRLETRQSSFTEQLDKCLDKLETKHNQFLQQLQAMQDNLNNIRMHQQHGLAEFKTQLQTELYQHRTNFDQHQLNSLTVLQDSLHKGLSEVRQQIMTLLNQNADQLSQRVDKLTQETGLRLAEISGQVEKRLTDGFEKTNATFTDIVKRLALIDEAQKKITELSTNVVSLQEILADKRSRGAFGEVQLSALIRNVLPEAAFALQHTFKDGRRADCLLFLPEPTGNIVIDAKFPLESFRRMTDTAATEAERRLAEKQFRIDINKHIQDIASKYIIPGETSDGAMMFIPAEAIFAEIHGRYPDLVESSQRARVWLVSPTTMMAILTTARAVLKDAATRQQIHIIQEHLGLLGKDFSRFQKRMENLARHIDQAHEDVKEVKTSADKISRRFGQIEKAELSPHLQSKIENIDL